MAKQQKGKKKCKGGYKLNDKGVCVRTKVSKGAETVGRTLAGILTWGASEAIIRSQKNKKKTKREKKKGKASVAGS